MKTHKLKTWPKPFKDVCDNYKIFEYRLNDRDFKEGDILMLLEWDPESKQYTNHRVDLDVTYCLYGGQFGIPEGYVIMSIQRR